MKKLSNAIDRFCYRHPRFGIPNLMKYIVAGNVLVYLLTVFGSYEAVSFLRFDWNAITHGELWRLVTFLFFPGYGTLRDAIFAFAMLYPDTRFLLFFFIPVKVKWLAWIDAAFFALAVVQSLLSGSLLGALLPVIAILNFLLFFWDRIADEFSYRRGRSRHQISHQTIQFKSAVRQQRKREQEQGYRHKCTVCGRTDTDCPELEFRYCSRCAGYHCFCQDHIFNHTHFTE